MLHTLKPLFLVSNPFQHLKVDFGSLKMDYFQQASQYQRAVVIWLRACRIIKREKERLFLQITAQTTICSI